jgi:hypothetical protein
MVRPFVCKYLKMYNLRMLLKGGRTMVCPYSDPVPPFR